MNLRPLVTGAEAVMLPSVPERGAASTELRTILLRVLRAMRAAVVETVLPEYREHRRLALDGLVRDQETPPETWFEELRRIVAAAAAAAVLEARALFERELQAFLRRFTATVRKGLGVQVPDEQFSSERVLAAQAVAAQRNAALIGSLSQEGVARVERVVLDSRLNRESARKLSSLLQAEFDALKARADLIAVDQIGSFHSDITRATHESAGIGAYAWQHQQDGNVRSLHEKLQGIVYRWGEPTGAEGGQQPGKPIRCRCRAAPVIEGAGGLPKRIDTPERKIRPRVPNTV